MKSINVSGLHYTEGRHRLLPCVFVTEEEMVRFKEPIATGIQVEYRDAPGAKKVNMAHLP